MKMEATRNSSSVKKVSYRVRKKVNDSSSIESFLRSHPEYQRSLNVLPSNYNFEIEKSICKIVQDNFCVVALQFPEGLLMYATVIADILTSYTKIARDYQNSLKTTTDSEKILSNDTRIDSVNNNSSKDSKENVSVDSSIKLDDIELKEPHISDIPGPSDVNSNSCNNLKSGDASKVCACSSKFPEQSTDSKTSPIEEDEGLKVFILGDVTYGACCVDDFICNKLGVDLLIHYGHSCLVPIQQTHVKVLYVFVEIKFDPSHIIHVIKSNFDKSKKLAILGTIQFLSNIFQIYNALREEQFNVLIPQGKPLSPAETLGCTSPLLPDDVPTAIFLADGRFHLESAMIQNPHVSFYRYDPYAKVLSTEGYDIELMKSVRMKSIQEAKKAKVFGLILGTLGRQGNIHIFNRLKTLAKSKGKIVLPFLMAEINLSKLQLITRVDAWVQVSCPRLSIDWGGGFSKPLLSPYEFEVAMEETIWKDVYPMDYYRLDSGPWGNYAANKTAQ